VVEESYNIEESSSQSLLGNEFFEQVEKFWKSIFEGRKTRRLYQKKQILFYEGNPTVGIFYIHSGRVKIYKTGPEGKQLILRIANAGDILGLESIFVGQSSTSTAEMIEQGDIGFIDKKSLVEVIQKTPQTALQIIDILAKELLSSEEERVDLAQSSVRERMARLLTLLSKRHGIPVSKGIRINLKLSREEMAGMIGTAAETTMRLLKEFKEEKMVDLEGKHIIILDKKRLGEQAHLEETA
jgi:CRP-like cAMP-binding protein